MPQSDGAPASSGMLIVDKPQGVTSHDVVAAARSALHTKKVGHAGTLDPMATGVLVIGFGNATRLLNYVVDHDKTYEATIRLGQRTTTDDADGEIIGSDDTDTAPALPSRELVEWTIAERLTGAIEQIPNTYSAIKINGQRAYDLAREGKDVELAARPVTIHEFAVLGVRPAVAANGQPVLDVDVRVDCSAGTYIRALARDLGDMLGVGGHLTRLRRTRVGRFAIPDGNIADHVASDTDSDTASDTQSDTTSGAPLAVPVVTAHAEARTFTNRSGEDVTRNRAVLDPSGEELVAAIIPMADAAKATMPTLAISAHDAAELRFGRRIPYDIRGVAAAIVPETGDVAAIVARARRGEAKPVTVFAADC